MTKARLNRFGDLVLDLGIASVSYPTEFTRRIKGNRTIIGILEVPGESNNVWDVKSLLRLCTNRGQFIIHGVKRPVKRNKYRDKYNSKFLFRSGEMADQQYARLHNSICELLHAEETHLSEVLENTTKSFSDEYEYDNGYVEHADFESVDLTPR